MQTARGCSGWTRAPRSRDPSASTFPVAGRDLTVTWVMRRAKGSRADHLRCLQAASGRPEVPQIGSVGRQSVLGGRRRLQPSLRLGVEGLDWPTFSGDREVANDAVAEAFALLRRECSHPRHDPVAEPPPEPSVAVGEENCRREEEEHPDSGKLVPPDHRVVATPAAAASAVVMFL
jgi:hypothetical protein